MSTSTLLYESVAGQDVVVYSSGIRGVESPSLEWGIKYPRSFSKSWRNDWEDFFVQFHNEFESASKFSSNEATIFSMPSKDEIGRRNFIAVVVGDDLSDPPYKLGKESSLSNTEKAALLNIKENIDRQTISEEDFLALLSDTGVSDRVFEMTQQIRSKFSDGEIRALINFLQEELGSS